MNPSAQRETVLPRRWLLTALALLPAIVLAIVLAIQGSQLDLPAPAPLKGQRMPITKSGHSVKPVVSAGTANGELSNRAALEEGARNDALTIGWIAVAVLLAAGAVLARLLWGGRAGARQSALSAAPAPAPAPARPDRDGAAARDRGVLVNACIEVSDVVPSESLRRRLRDALREAGVDTVEADHGARFDAASQRVVDRVVTGDPDLHNRIAATERAGYVDRGRQIREPEVLVYNLEDGSRA